MAQQTEADIVSEAKQVNRSEPKRPEEHGEAHGADSTSVTELEVSKNHAAQLGEESGKPAEVPDAAHVRCVYSRNLQKRSNPGSALPLFHAYDGVVVDIITPFIALFLILVRNVRLMSVVRFVRSAELKQIGKSPWCQEPPDISAQIRNENEAMFPDEGGMGPGGMSMGHPGPSNRLASPARPAPQRPGEPGTETHSGSADGWKRGPYWRGGPRPHAMGGIRSRLVDGDGMQRAASDAEQLGPGGYGQGQHPQEEQGRAGSMPLSSRGSGWRGGDGDGGARPRGPPGLGGPDAGQRQPRGPDGSRTGMAAGRGRALAAKGPSSAAAAAMGRGRGMSQLSPSKLPNASAGSDAAAPASDGDWRSAKERGDRPDTIRDWQQMGSRQAPGQHRDQHPQQRDRGAAQVGGGSGRGEPRGGAPGDDGPPPPWMGGSSEGGSGRRMTAAEMEAEHQAMREAARVGAPSTTAARPPSRPQGEPEALTDADWADLLEENSDGKSPAAGAALQARSKSGGNPPPTTPSRPPPGFENAVRAGSKAPPPGFEQPSQTAEAPSPAPASAPSVVGSPTSIGSSLLAALNAPKAAAATASKPQNSRFAGKFFQLEDIDSDGAEQASGVAATDTSKASAGDSAAASRLVAPQSGPKDPTLAAGSVGPSPFAKVAQEVQPQTAFKLAELSITSAQTVPAPSTVHITPPLEGLPPLQQPQTAKQPAPAAIGGRGAGSGSSFLALLQQQQQLQQSQQSMQPPAVVPAAVQQAPQPGYHTSQSGLTHSQPGMAPILPQFPSSQLPIDGMQLGHLLPPQLSAHQKPLQQQQQQHILANLFKTAAINNQQPGGGAGGGQLLPGSQPAGLVGGRSAAHLDAGISQQAPLALNYSQGVASALQPGIIGGKPPVVGARPGNEGQTLLSLLQQRMSSAASSQPVRPSLSQPQGTDQLLRLLEQQQRVQTSAAMSAPINQYYSQLPGQQANHQSQQLARYQAAQQQQQQAQQQQAQQAALEAQHRAHQQHLQAQRQQQQQQSAFQQEQLRQQYSRQLQRMQHRLPQLALPPLQHTAQHQPRASPPPPPPPAQNVLSAGLGYGGSMVNQHNSAQMLGYDHQMQPHDNTDQLLRLLQQANQGR